MNDIGINIVDIVFLVIVLLSAVLSFQKGFIQEVMRISSWVGAGFVALYSYNPILPYIKQYIDMEIGASAITGASSFILSLIIFYIISHFISGIVRYSPIGSLNKSLGFIFGGLRGIIICSALYISVLYISGGKKIDAFENAKTQGILESSSSIMIALLPENFETKINNTVNLIKDKSNQAKKLNDTFNKLNKPKLGKDEIGDLIDKIE